MIKNIGAEGLFIRTSRKIAEGQTILLKFPLFRFDKIIQISGKVVRREHSGFAVDFDEPIDDLISKEGLFPDIVHEGNR